MMSQQSHERGERILEATRELLAERGDSAVTVRELARRGGVSIPTLYNRFGGKDELIAAAVRSRFSGVLRSVEAEGEAVKRAQARWRRSCAHRRMPFPKASFGLQSLPSQEPHPGFCSRA
jgi:AcrR family transcriptional regulator